MSSTRKPVRIPGFKKKTSPVYKSWAGMIRRCTYPDGTDYARYGGRGITVCERWLVFENFLADMGPSHVPGLTIERKDNDGPYSPDNCRWATMKEQCENRSSTHLLTDPATGETCTISEWAKRTGISRLTIHSRIRLGRTRFEDICAVGRLPYTRHHFSEAREVVD